jgi:A/G-specific adenine glycosylase
MVDTPAKNSPSRIDTRCRSRLLAWYAVHHRVLPWRTSVDPYAVWLSEIMLQQTQVDTVLPYYHRFLERFPTIATLASAPLEEVLKAWENLGYYSRARHLHEAAAQIVERHGGQLPARWEELIRLPGIGRYTAGAVLSIAFGQALPAVDGNVRRVISRLCALEESVDDPSGREAIERLLHPLIPQKDPGLFNQALMELGALICKPKNPTCTVCPLGDFCRAKALGRTAQLPLRKKRRAVPHKEVTAALLGDGNGRLLIVRRPAGGLLGSLWKFPGGILNPGEPLAEGLRRTVCQELGVGIAVGSQIAAVKHAYTHFRITLTAFACTFADGWPDPHGRKWRWASLSELNALPFSKADRLIALAMDPEWPFAGDGIPVFSTTARR